LDPLFYEIDGLIQTSGYMNGLPSHKLKELLDALNDRFITAINKGEGPNPCRKTLLSNKMIGSLGYRKQTRKSLVRTQLFLNQQDWA